MGQSPREQPRWSDPNWRREHLRAWSIKERQVHEHPSWAAARKRFAANLEREQQRQQFETHIRAVAAGEPLTEEARQHVRQFIGIND